MDILILPLLVVTVLLLERKYSVSEDSSLQISCLLRTVGGRMTEGESSSYTSGIIWKEFLMTQCPWSMVC